MAAPTGTTDPFGAQTSGVTSYRSLAYDLIKEAYSYCQIALDTEGEALTAGYVSEGMKTLNALVSTLQGQGIHLWTYQEGYLFLEAGVNSYALENVRATNRYLQTTSTTNIVAAGNTVSLTSVSELDTDWWIGVMDSTNNLVWREVLSVADPVVTISSTWPANILAGADVIYYQNQVRPVERVLDVRRAGAVSVRNETTIAFKSHESYVRLPDKDSQGSVSQATYDRVLPEGIMYVWQTPADSSEQVRFTYERKIEDFIDTDDCPDFPKYWTEALIFALAKRLKMKYRVPPMVAQEINDMAEASMMDALDFDNANYDIDVTINGHTR